jgi:NADPH:quinone reductase-like Zn-dependent oxidoreductase
MKAVEISKFGPPEVLRFCEMPVPGIEEGDVRVRVRAIGLNFADVFARLGYYPGIPKPPFVPGIEFAGTVEGVGKSVKTYRKGDRVFGFTRQKAYAEFVSVSATLVLRMSKKMSFEEAAAFGVTYLTAYHALITLGQIRKGERLLLHAAAGGVGTAALQIAGHLGVKVYATVGSHSKFRIVRELGAAIAINYAEEDFAEIIRRDTDGKGVDVILDSVGGKVFRKGWKLLAPMGRYVLYGFAAVADHKRVPKLKALREAVSMPLIYPPSIISKNVSLMGFNLYFLIEKAGYLREAMHELLRWHEKGILSPVIGAVYHFEQIHEAHEFLQSRRSVGKVVVTVGGEK